MKKSFYLILFCFLIISCPLTLQAQYKKRGPIKRPQNIIKLSLSDPFTFRGIVTGSYERVLVNNFSFQFSYSNHSLIQQPDAHKNGFGIKPEIKYYFLRQDKAPHGLYSSAYFFYDKLDNQFSRFDKNANSVVDYYEKTTLKGGGLYIGYQYLVGNRLALDVFVGPRATNDYTHTQPSIDGRKLNRSYYIGPETRMEFHAGFNIGFAF